MNLCCSLLTRHVRTPEGNGFWVLPVARDGYRYFVLFGRAVAGTHVQTFSTGVKHCPWCGHELRHLIEAQPEAFDRAAQGFADLVSR